MFVTVIKINLSVVGSRIQCGSTNLLADHGTACPAALENVDDISMSVPGVASHHLYNGYKVWVCP